MNTQANFVADHFGHDHIFIIIGSDNIQKCPNSPIDLPVQSIDSFSGIIN